MFEQIAHCKFLLVREHREDTLKCLVLFLTQNDEITETVSIRSKRVAEERAYGQILPVPRILVDLQRL